MNRDAVLPVAFALVAVVGLGLAAATLDSAVRPASDDGGESGGSGLIEIRTQSESALDLPAPAVGLAPFLAGYLLVVVSGAYAIYRLYGVSFYLALVAGFAVTVVVLGLTDPAGLQGYETNTPPSPTGATDAEAADPGGSPPPYLFYLLAGGVAVAGWSLYRATGDDVVESERRDGGGVETTTEDGRLDEVRRAAGDAARRIETDANADLDNEVFRAWREMTEHLPVDRPESSTPAEFAAAAVDAGMDADTVEELTALFEQIRYGGERATEDRERRAVESLRRLSRDGGDDA